MNQKVVLYKLSLITLDASLTSLGSQRYVFENYIWVSNKFHFSAFLHFQQQMDIKQINESILLCFHQFCFETLFHYRVEVDSSMARNQPTFLIASDCFREACYKSPMKCSFIKVKSPISSDRTAVRSFESCFHEK